MSVELVCKLHGPAEVEAMLYGLCRVALLQIKGGGLPRLYGGSIRYQWTPHRDARWQTPRETARLGTGDCKALVAYRVGELWAAGQFAAPLVVKVRPGLMHVRVRTLAGMEDPSARLGMK